MFKKGHPRYGGRIKGQTNKNYMSCQFWYGMVAENAENLGSEKKISIAFQVLNLLMPKVSNLPAEPGDSVQNVQQALDMIKKMEGAIETNTPPPSGGTNGAPRPTD